MHNFYPTLQSETRSAWRTAAEVQLAAYEHEKRRWQLLNGEPALDRPQTPARRSQPAWSPLRLLAILLG